MPALEDRLTLVAWFAQAMGYRDNAHMLHELKSAGEGWGDARNKTLEIMLSSTAQPAADARMLNELDGEIREDWNAVNRGRRAPMALKYFQYLACLAPALLMRRLSETPDELLDELRRIGRQSARLESFEDINSINKLAFWMATGSGKTLLMHMHYRMFMRRRPFAPDNVLLITPNEELSRQHIAEMRASNIPCFRHGESGGATRTPADVCVIEISKLVSENGGRKKGRGESVPVEAFEGRNLVFVDEGHKGSRGDAWFERRDKLAQNGFVFEYSATFGQALDAEEKGGRTAEYARAILFDYSYRFFYGDGYGKDFKILNIAGNALPNAGGASPERDLMMLGNLLAFFQQQTAFDGRGESWRHYNIEKPLLLLLGARVTGGAAGKSESEAGTDMVDTIAFLHRVAADKDAGGRAWLRQAAEKILAGRSGISDGDGGDVFADRFPLLKQTFAGRYAEMCAALGKKIFYAAAPGALQIRLLQQTKSDGSEIALKVGDGNPPFGLVYVGSPKKLCELISARVPGAEIANDKIQKPLFAEAHTPASPVNILIGARKFMEGWSSWRVSGMGLLNIGRNEGTQIIQLFGRGVRLKGKGFSLKRSDALKRERGDNPPENLRLLETLNIFAIRADFMTKFREYLQREGVPEVFDLPLMLNPQIKGGNLQTLKIPPAEEFTEMVELTATDGLAVKLHMGVKTQTLDSAAGAIRIAAGGGAPAAETFDGMKPLLNYDRLHRRLLEYKRAAQRHNLIIRRDALPDILDCCEIHGEGAPAAACADLRRTHDTAFSALRAYADKLYYRRQKQWETGKMEYEPLVKTSGERRSTISVMPGSGEVLEKMRKLMEEEVEPYLNSASDQPLKRFGAPRGKYGGVDKIVFDVHIYVPLLLGKHADNITLSPPGLTESETAFVQNLLDYVKANRAEGEEVFLLRNSGRGRGVGFYEDEGFYPDFILWIKRKEEQRVIFVEPHGMLHAPVYEKDFKARLWEHLRALSKKLSRGARGKNVGLDAYIISATSHKDLKKKYGDGNWSKADFARRHILFAEDGAGMVRQIFHPPEKN